MINLGGEF